MLFKQLNDSFCFVFWTLYPYIWSLSHVSKTSSGRGALRFLMLFFILIYLLSNNPQFIRRIVDKYLLSPSIQARWHFILSFIFVAVQPYSLFIRFNPRPNRIKSIYYFSGFVNFCTGLCYWQSWSSALGSGCIVHYHRPSVRQSHCGHEHTTICTK